MGMNAKTSLHSAYYENSTKVIGRIPEKHNTVVINGFWNPCNPKMNCLGGRHQDPFHLAHLYVWSYLIMSRTNWMLFLEIMEENESVTLYYSVRLKWETWADTLKSITGQYHAGRQSVQFWCEDRFANDTRLMRLANQLDCESVSLFVLRYLC